MKLGDLHTTAADYIDIFSMELIIDHNKREKACQVVKNLRCRMMGLEEEEADEVIAVS